MRKIYVFPDTETFCQEAARRIVAQIQTKPTSVIGLSTGRTTGRIHQALVEQIQQQGVDCSRVLFVGVDEVTGVDREYFGACYKMIHTEVLDPLHLGDEQFRILPTHSDDWDATCASFSRLLDDLGGIDLLELGLGENGHLGFNQPGTPFESDVRTSTMTPELEERIRRETHTPSEVPLGGATLGIVNIMHARRILLVANGMNKTEVVRQMLQGPISTQLPASILQLHPQCEFYLDADAAKQIMQYFPADLASSKWNLKLTK